MQGFSISATLKVKKPVSKKDANKLQLILKNIERLFFTKQSLFFSICLPVSLKMYVSSELSFLFIINQKPESIILNYNPKSRSSKSRFHYQILIIIFLRYIKLTTSNQNPVNSIAPNNEAFTGDKPKDK